MVRFMLWPLYPIAYICTSWTAVSQPICNLRNFQFVVTLQQQRSFIALSRQQCKALQILWNEASFTLRRMTVCFILEFSCCVSHRGNMVSIFFLSQSCALCERLQDILQLKWTTHQQSAYDKMATVRRFSNACLTFQLDGLGKND